MTTLQARRLPVQPGASGWVAMLPPRQPKAALQGKTTADVVVVGAGFAGLSAARRMSQLDPTLRVVVLEAGIVGQGPAGRNSGFIIDLPHEVSAESLGDDSSAHARRDIFKNRAAIARIRAWLRNMVGAPRSLPCRAAIPSRGALRGITTWWTMPAS